MSHVPLWLVLFSLGFAAGWWLPWPMLWVLLGYGGAILLVSGAILLGQRLGRLP